MTSLQTSTCLAAIVLATAGSQAFATTTVSTDTTSALATSSSGEIEITEDGSITVDGGSAVTVDSDDAVTNDGAIAVGDADDAIGITVDAGTVADIANSGTISVTEDYVPDDDDSNGIADNAIASASDRYGIYVAGGAATAGTIDNSGTILIEGLNSGGIVVDGSYTGSITHSGSIYVTGDYSAGIKTQDVTGDITIEGTVKVIGEGARALAMEGDIDGTLTIQGVVAQAASYTNDDGTTTYLSRSDLRVSAPAVEVSGDVTGGIIVAIPPTDSDSDNDDEDGDGIDDSDEGTGSITSYGNGPAILVGGSADTTIGSVTGNAGTHSLVVDGTVSANAYYSSTDAYAIVIGGQGGAVTLTDGIGVSGTVSATTYDSAATAILVNAGSTVGTLYNSGTISALITSSGEGTLTAIQDLSGTLTTIENTGYISTGGSSEDTRIAIDLSANTTGVTISQYINETDAETKAENEEDGDEDTTVYTYISGDIITGSGDDTLSVSSGQIIGDTYFNAGSDTFSLSGDAVYSGDVYFGSGSASMTLSGEASFTGNLDFASQTATLALADDAVFTGTLSSSTALSVNVQGGNFAAGAAQTLSLASLTVGSGGTITAYVDPEAGTSSLFDVGIATFESGAKVAARISSLKNAEGSYVILTADVLAGSPSFDAETTELPYIFDGSVTVDGTDLVLEISRKAAGDLGLTRAATSAYDAVYEAASNDDSLSESFLEIEDADTLQEQVDQLLPDNAGGVFDAVTRGSRLAAKHITDDSSFFDISDVGAWLEPLMWHSGKDATGTVAYKANGWGLSGGVERHTRIGRIGVSYAFLNGTVKNNGGTGKLDTTQHEFAAFWRGGKGPFLAFARIGAARISVKSDRSFTGTIDDVDFTYSTEGSWDGWLWSGMAGASWSFDLTDRLTFKPMAVLDYYRLNEDGYAESGSDGAIDLTVLKRHSTSTTATTTLTASYRFGQRSRDERPLTIELEGGRRNMLGGSLGTTSAYFEDGDTFSISPDKLQGAWLGEARVLAGGWDFTWQLAGRVEETAGGADYSARASLSVAF